MISLGVEQGPDVEVRDAPDVDHTAALVSLLRGQAEGAGAGHVPAASTEIAALLAGRIFAGARVDGPPAAVEALTPATLALASSLLVRRGECVFVRYHGQPVRLIPVSGPPNVTGGWNPDSWLYDVSLAAPSGSDQVVVRRAEVLHVLTDPDPVRPWQGASPAAGGLGALASRAGRALLGELSTPAARLIPAPEGVTDADKSGMRDAILQNRGRVSFPTTMAKGMSQGTQAAPAGDWRQVRIGPEPTAAQVQATTDVEARLSAALGLHPSAMNPAATAASIREARRQLQIDVVEPLAALVASDAGRLFGAPVRLTWPARTDVELVMARTAKTLIEAGVPPDAALSAAGWTGLTTAATGDEE